MKAYNFPVDYVLYDMSYANMIMYGAVIPSYKSKKDKSTEKQQEIVKVDDPRNRERVKQIFEQFD